MTITSAPKTSFYKAGGNLGPKDQCYVDRPADAELFDALRTGHYCYVLTSRQMGKSSLMHRTADRLRDEGITPILVDLTGIGTQVTREQWYYGMLAEIGRQLSLTREMEQYWDDNAQHGPLYRFTHALTDIVLRYTETAVTLFIDEIDSVASVKKHFSTDEFFAAIRQCYNNRASSKEMERLTFCLLGVSTPADLIQDVNTTPFSIGRQIELTDFTLEEAKPLISNLDDNYDRASKKLARIFYWTNGHPYLTQKLCLEMSRDRNCAVSQVDALCQKLFFASTVRKSEDNLIFVHKLLFNGPTETTIRPSSVGASPDEKIVDGAAALLTMYRAIYSGKRVPNNPADPLVAHLRLAGVVRSENGRLCLRNRIYARVFDRRWIDDAMPDAELRRVNAAYRRGVLRTIAVFGTIAAISLTAFIITHNALNQTHDALKKANYMRALGDLTQAQEAIQEPDLGRAEKLLKEAVKLGDKSMPDRFSWRYLWRASHEAERTFQCGGAVLAVAALKDGKTAAAIVDNGTLQLWDINTGQLEQQPIPLGVKPTIATFTDDKAAVAVGTANGSISAYEVPSGRRYASVPGNGAMPTGLSIAHSRFTIAASFPVRGPEIIDLLTQKVLSNISYVGKNASISAAITPDGRHFAVGYFNGDILCGLTGDRHQPKRIVDPLHIAITCLRYSDDGSLLIAGDFNGNVRILNGVTGHEIRRVQANHAKISDVCLDPSTQSFISGGTDSQLHVWDLATGQSLGRLSGHHDNVSSLALFPRGTVVSGSGDGTIRVWHPRADQPEITTNLAIDLDGFVNSMANDRYVVVPLRGTTMCLMDLNDESSVLCVPGRKDIVACAVTPNLKWLVIGRYGSLEVWSVSERKMVRRFSEPIISAITVSGDGRLVGVAYQNRTIDVFNTHDWRVSHIVSNVSTVLSLTFSSDGSTMAVGGNSSFVEVFSLDRRQIIAKLSTGAQITDNVVFSPKGNMLAANTCHGPTSLWDTSSWKRSLEIQSPPDVAPGAFLFSPNGTEVATGDGNGGVKLWNVSTGDEIVSLNNEPPCIDSMAFSADGTRLVAIAGNTLYRWQAPPVTAAERQ